MVEYITSENDIYQTLKSYKDIVNWYERTDKNVEEAIVIDIVGEENKYFHDGGQSIAQTVQIMHVCKHKNAEFRKDFAKFMKQHFHYNFTTSYDDNEGYWVSIYQLEHILKEWS